MLKVDFYELNEIEDSLLKYAVIVSNYNGKWIYCKHKKRNTWEIPGGRREEQEDIIETAKRELFEETGAIQFKLEAICNYCVQREDKSYGLLCYASITQLGDLPDNEIGCIDFFSEEPSNLTYPDIQPKLFTKVLEVKGLL